jgi:2-polyprenyl-3-methyl-5-hydroxy-6-metoxy-1,4-benzoquinol methylase
VITLDTQFFKPQTACPLCHDRQHRHAGRPRFQRLYEAPQGLVELTEEVERERRLARCAGCGLLYNRLIPRSRTLDALYDVPVAGATWKFAAGRRLMGEKLAFLKMLPMDQPLRALDVGCYTGGFLEMLPGHWSKYGLDPNSEALGLARQRLPAGCFWQGQLESFAPEGRQFDLITLWDVAEHLDDVDGAFRKLSQMLAPQGLLVMETGDAESRVARSMRQGWYYVNCLEHFCVFSENVLRARLPRYGLEVTTCLKTVHHRYGKHLALASRLLFWSYWAATWGGRLPGAWRALSKALRRNGASYPPPAADHILVVARKV